MRPWVQSSAFAKKFKKHGIFMSSAAVAFSFHPGWGDGTQVIRLEQQCLNLLSHLTGPALFCDTKSHNNPEWSWTQDPQPPEYKCKMIKYWEHCTTTNRRINVMVIIKPCLLWKEKGNTGKERWMPSLRTKSPLLLICERIHKKLTIKTVF